MQGAIVDFLQSQELEFDAEEDQDDEEIDEEEQERAEIEQSDRLVSAEENQPSFHQYGYERENQENEEIDEIEENQEIEDEQSQRDESDNGLNSSELSFHFACLNHSSEEYTYYSPSTRQLYCAQCLLVDENVRNLGDLRSIRRSLPLIMQHFQDLLNNVEVSRSLLENRKKDSEIKFDDVKAKMNSIKYFVEMKFEELDEQINMIKTGIIDSLDSTFEQLLEELKGVGDKFESKIEYFDAILGQVREIQSDVTVLLTLERKF